MTDELKMTRIAVPRAKTLPGLIARARTYRLVLDDSGLWVIYLGNAMGPEVKNMGLFAKMISGVILKRIRIRIEKHIAKGEAELMGLPLLEQVKRKHSFHVPVSETGAIEADLGKLESPALKIRSAAGKLRIIGAETDFEGFARIAAAFE